MREYLSAYGWRNTLQIYPYLPDESHDPTLHCTLILSPLQEKGKERGDVNEFQITLVHERASCARCQRGGQWALLYAISRLPPDSPGCRDWEVLSLTHRASPHSRRLLDAWLVEQGSYATVPLMNSVEKWGFPTRGDSTGVCNLGNLAGHRGSLRAVHISSMDTSRSDAIYASALRPI